MRSSVRFFFNACARTLELHSFPTRRSSDLLGFAAVGRRARYYRRPVEDAVILRAAIPENHRVFDWPAVVARSGEHTSELQSHVKLVCRLLREKKNIVNGACQEHVRIVRFVS